MVERQVALVTGSSRGIGKEIAIELARNGWCVALNYFNDPRPMVDATMAEICSIQLCLALRKRIEAQSRKRRTPFAILKSAIILR